MSRGETDVRSNLAAAYVRISTEHQQYSTSNQMDVIREYAKRRGLQIVREYSDEGKSGLPASTAALPFPAAFGCLFLPLRLCSMLDAIRFAY